MRANNGMDLIKFFLQIQAQYLFQYGFVDQIAVMFSMMLKFRSFLFSRAHL